MFRGGKGAVLEREACFDHSSIAKQGHAHSKRSLCAVGLGQGLWFKTQAP